jgi:hypothetical protein
MFQKNSHRDGDVCKRGTLVSTSPSWMTAKLEKLNRLPPSSLSTEESWENLCCPVKVWGRDQNAGPN